MTPETGLDSKYFGIIVQNERKPLVLVEGRRRLFGNIREEFANNVSDGSLLIAEQQNEHEKLMCRVCKVMSYPQQGGGPFRHYNEYITNTELEPLSIINGLSIDNICNNNFNGYQLRKPATNELKLYFNIPETGVIIGDLVIDRSIEPIPYPIPSHLFYRSLFVCGAKGSGKTTCLFSVLPKITGIEDTEMSPPAIVILDVEGEFSKPHMHGLFSESGAEVNQQCLSTDLEIATTTLNLSQIHYEDFANFTPNLTLNSITILESVLKELTFHYKEKGISRGGKEILKDIQTTVFRKGGVHHSQRDAVIRVLMSNVFSIFNQDKLPILTPEDLVISGKVSILDVSTLTDDQQRSVALYLLSIFDRYKNRSQDSTGLLLVMDEAQKLFPQKGDLKQEYAKRLAKFVGHIVRRGRRRHYGVVLSTQYPADVSREVVELCDTKFIFKMSGPKEWLRLTLGDTSFARLASQFDVGEAFVVSNVLGFQEPITIKFPLVEVEY